MPGLECVSESVELLPLPSSRLVEVRKCFTYLRPWKGEPIQDTYGGKAVVDFRGEPTFAELAILGYLREEGWEGVWIDTYRNKFRTGLPEIAAPVDLPDGPLHLYERIKEANGKRSGFWDVLAWQGNEFLFAESKRLKKDRLGPAQYQWLESALSCGLPLTSFLIVEWDLKQ